MAKPAAPIRPSTPSLTPAPLRETDLYPPVKALLELQGYEVKAEIGAADVVALRGDEDPVIVELKTGFSLSLFHQAVQRQSVTDAVYVAVHMGRGAPFARALKSNTALCRRLGLGLMTVRLAAPGANPATGLVQIHLDPLPYRPRHQPRRKAALLKEFARRTGDPNKGGATRRGLITAYRQDALRCALALSKSGQTRAAAVAAACGVAQARRVMADNHYGWFLRVQRGIYTLGPDGHDALTRFAGEIAQLTQQDPPPASRFDPPQGPAPPRRVRTRKP